MGNGDLPAMPCKIKSKADAYGDGQQITIEKDCVGLTKREYFAAMGMQGMAALYGGGNPEYLAKCATEAADALLKALDEE